MDLAEARRQFPILQERTYLFSGGHSPACSGAREAAQRLMDEWTFEIADLYGRLREEQDIVRGLFAELIGASADEIAIVESTGMGSNLAVEMIEPRAGGNVVFDEWSYPSSIYPWTLPERAQVERRFVPARDGRIEVDDLARAIDDDTLAVSISHVTQGEGFRQDLGAVAEAAHEHGALLLVDAAQSAGALRIDVKEQGVDFLAAGACKWLLGASGLAYFYANRRHLEAMPPHAAAPGSASSHHPAETSKFEPKPGAERLQTGIPNLIGLAASRPGLEILLGVGMDKVEEHVLDLSGYCVGGLRERGLEVLTPQEPERRGGVVAVVMEDPLEAEAFMAERKVDVYGGHTYNSTLRIDPHVFNNRDDLDRFFEVLDEYLG